MAILVLMSCPAKPEIQPCESPEPDIGVYPELQAAFVGIIVTSLPHRGSSAAPEERLLWHRFLRCYCHTGSRAPPKGGAFAFLGQLKSGAFGYRRFSATDIRLRAFDYRRSTAGVRLHRYSATGIRHRCSTTVFGYRRLVCSAVNIPSSSSAGRGGQPGIVTSTGSHLASGPHTA